MFRGLSGGFEASEGVAVVQVEAEAWLVTASFVVEAQYHTANILRPRILGLPLRGISETYMHDDVSLGLACVL